MQRRMKHWPVLVGLLAVGLFVWAVVFAVYRLGPVGKDAAVDYEKTPMSWRFAEYLQAEDIVEMRLYDPSTPWKEGVMQYEVLTAEEAEQILALLRQLQQYLVVHDTPTEADKAVDETYHQWWIWYEHPQEPYRYRNIGILFTDGSLLVFEAAPEVWNGVDIYATIYAREPEDPFDYLDVTRFWVPEYPERNPPEALAELGNFSSDLLWKYYGLEYPRWRLGKFIYEE